MKNLNQLLQVLIDNKIEFVLVGGFAGVVHGSSLVTRDLDICALITPEHIEKLRRCLKAYNPTHRMTPQRISFMTHPTDPQGWNNIYLETDLGILDLINEVSGVGDYQRVQSQAVEIEVFNRKCKVISIDDLILAKKFLGREKDKIAVKELEIIRSKQP